MEGDLYTFSEREFIRWDIESGNKKVIYETDEDPTTNQIEISDMYKVRLYVTKKFLIATLVGFGVAKWNKDIGLLIDYIDYRQFNETFMYNNILYFYNPYEIQKYNVWFFHEKTFSKCRSDIFVNVNINTINNKEIYFITHRTIDEKSYYIQMFDSYTKTSIANFTDESWINEEAPIVVYSNYNKLIVQHYETTNNMRQINIWNLKNKDEQIKFRFPLPKKSWIVDEFSYDLKYNEINSLVEIVKLDMLKGEVIDIYRFNNLPSNCCDLFAIYSKYIFLAMYEESEKNGEVYQYEILDKHNTNVKLILQ